MTHLIQNILPIIIITESILAAGILFFYQKWGSGLYWLAAGILNFSVIFLIKKWG
jgi:hypothetical protein